MNSAEDERWQPDEALALTVRTRSLEVKDLSGPDRSWLVASLTIQGWTVAAIADRLKCSLRLVQTIKTEPMTRVALYALGLAHELADERGLRHVESSLAAGQLAACQREIARLSSQRDALLAQLARMRKEHTNVSDASAVPVPGLRRIARPARPSPGGT